MDIKRKLLSRKFWAAAAGFAVPLLVCFGVEQDKALQFCGLLTSGASLVSYILGESYIDGKAIEGKEAQELQSN